MNLSRKIIVSMLMLFGLPAFAEELTKDLQKACLSEPLRDHKGKLCNLVNFQRYLCSQF